MASIDAATLFRVDGLVAVITGGATGIGLMMAKALEANGASKVYVVGRRKGKLEEAANQAKHGNIIPIQGDVSSKESLEQIADQVRSEVGYINLLVANSGISGPQISSVPKDASLSDFKKHAWSTPMEEFTNTYAVNSTGVWYTVLAFLELLDAGNKKGNMGEVKSQVIATSSIGGYNRMSAAGIAYNTSKAATTHMIKQLATLMVPHSIRFNALAPGLFPSELAAPLLELANGDMTKEGAFEKSFIPAGRTGSEEDMAGTILYLASRAGAYLNGTIVVIDGGRLSLLPATY
ncbi:hypothetical protein LTR04_006784 [Oleoguttula sp. CCFEE 6159]|nr:hypothetical protein LTR04_006784 [Oleoguttula sp. CCFEE 6159]